MSRRSPNTSQRRGQRLLRQRTGTDTGRVALPTPLNTIVLILVSPYVQGSASASEASSSPPRIEQQFAGGAPRLDVQVRLLGFPKRIACGDLDMQVAFADHVEQVRGVLQQ